MKLASLRGYKTKIILSTLTIAAVATPAAVFAMTQLSHTDGSYAAEDSTQPAEIATEINPATPTVPDTDTNTPTDTEGDTTPTNAMPAPFVDQNFYNCVETEFKKEFPTETIPATGLTDAQLAKITSLGCRTKNITDVSGLEKMTALTKLDLYGNKITTINVAYNTKLTNLTVDRNQLTNIDLTHNLDLEVLNIEYNKLSTIDLTKNTKLGTIYITNNQLTTLNIKHNPQLTHLFAGSNQLTSIDLANNAELIAVSLFDNKLTTFSAPNSPLLYELYLGSNNLTTIDVTNNLALNSLYIYDNALTSIDLSKNTQLHSLSAHSNQFNSLDISQNNQLERLNIMYTPIQSLDVSHNENLTMLVAENILLYTNAQPVREGSALKYNLNNLKFIGADSSNTIVNTENYTFNENDKVLTVTNLGAAQNYAQITTTDETVPGNTYKIYLADAPEPTPDPTPGSEAEGANAAGAPNTGAESIAKPKLSDNSGAMSTINLAVVIALTALASITLFTILRLKCILKVKR